MLGRERRDRLLIHVTLLLKIIRSDFILTSVDFLENLTELCLQLLGQLTALILLLSQLL